MTTGELGPDAADAGIVAGRAAVGEAGTEFSSRTVRTGRPRAMMFADATEAEAEAAADAAAAAFLHVQTQDEGRSPSALLRSIAAAVEDRRADLVRIAADETGLAPTRLEGELTRTTAQLELLAAEAAARSGRALDVDPGTDVAPELVLGQVPLGPVAVFGASNFPFAFGVLGGDTAAALAAGCPVVAKGHPAHPETSQLFGEIVTQTLEREGWPAGWFSLLHGRGTRIGQALVTADGIAAAAFTGSTRGGLALAAAAARRRVPIPVFAELGGINALYLLPHAASDAAADAASAFIDGLTRSVTGDGGQFCTKPGLLVLVDDEASRRVVDGLTRALAQVSSSPLLTPGIHAALVTGQDRLSSHAGVTVLHEGPSADQSSTAPVASFLAAVSSHALRSDPTIAEELFGPALVVVRCKSVADLVDLVGAIPPGLTATVHAGADDASTAAALLRRLRLRAGRVLFGGFPTGVRVGRATTHGGPFPATTAPGTTSVGARAIDRFVRPVTYQDLPADLRERALTWT
ncbi:aldehyde dehydrogenase family protein [Microbacterium sp. ZW T5_56]|uniref:aldehyde dehydrogenase family protein n=1 Tax=Microbacterium sp. ZW T5_56 TaxID=3378081 RepID=UPI003853CE0D